MKTVGTTISATIPINIFKVQIDVDISFLRKAIADFEYENDGLIPYLIMNEKTLNELKIKAYDTFGLYNAFVHLEAQVRECNYINKFEECKIVIDCTLEDGQVLLR
jgi:hypothetical protein